jgi:hypothetical protein
VLKQFFLDNFRIKMIIASWAEPWFEDAAVNTIVTVLEREQNNHTRSDNVIHFVKLKKKLEELIPFTDLRLESQKRWDRIDGIVDTIESAKHDRRLRQVSSTISCLETDEMRIRLVKQSDILNELQETVGFSKWGKYLRAPDVYFEILERCKDKLVPLKKIADVRFGIKTGINEFFYLERIADGKKGLVRCRNERGWEGEIEECYLRKVIKSPRESETIVIDPSKLKYEIFICDRSKTELKTMGQSSSLKYIEWGEKQRTEGNKPWPEVPSVQGRKHWWSLGRTKLPEIIIPAGIADVFKVFDNAPNILNDKRLYKVYINGEESLKYLMNSTLFSFFIEANSRISLGDGLVDLTVYEVEETLVPKPALLGSAVNDKMLKLYKKTSAKKVKSIFDEVKGEDRKTLDGAVLKALGLTAEEYLPRIYDGLCEMVRERLELPKMRKKQQKEKVRISFDQVKASVIKDCLPTGAVRRFPEDFYEGTYAKLEFETYQTSGMKLRSEPLMGHCELKDETGKTILLIEGESKAEFAMILAKENVYQLKIPTSEKVVDNILKGYHRYVKGLRKSLEEDAQQKLHDWSVAERMAREILSEFGMPFG